MAKKTEGLPVELREKHAKIGRRLAEIQTELEELKEMWAARRTEHKADVTALEEERAKLSRELLSNQGDLIPPT